jgi:hypothetical protein
MKTSSFAVGDLVEVKRTKVGKRREELWLPATVVGVSHLGIAVEFNSGRTEMVEKRYTRLKVEDST